MGRRDLLDYAGIFAGVAITALALDWFLIPNMIAAGGASGLATVIHHLTKLPVGLLMVLINIPLFLASVRTFGRHFGAKTVFGTALLSILIDLVAIVLPEPLTQDPLLASLYGGVLTGVGIGLTFRFNGTTGGTDIAARLLKKYTSLSVGRALLFIDMAIIILAGLVFRQPDLSLYALITVFVTSKAIDLILEGEDYARAAFIITKDPADIVQNIFAVLGRGVTTIEGRGAYTGTDRQVLLCVVSRAEQSRLREIVEATDPKAFVIITSASEVLGEGFMEFGAN
ncbi:MAG TPA: hypothetical protein DHD79_07965 [Firmicutes bacterium]|nr:hypothetical protein [Bacillota bacterium]HAW71985.1 hypothetical protein [Bacillota bacterium]HAZ23055.1 hypothetical protein [Bacillota bacterium]HBE04864.1 hypothetical protein [Bacillota bacterium]HBL49272.1 hypothetical protein [Bacillota bacterium]